MSDVQQTRPRRPPPLDVRVAHVERRPGNFVQVVLGGDALRAFTWPGAGSHLKFFPFSDPPSDADPGGRPLSRTYTPRAFDPARCELSLEFLLHGEGPATSWAFSASVGDDVRVSVPRAKYEVPLVATWLVLAGDDSAIPAIATILETRPHASATVLIETLSSGGDRPELPLRDNDVISWTAAQPGAPGASLEQAVRDWTMPAGVGAVWVACEALAVRRIRTHLLDERELPRELVVTRGYWREGAANHPDHDFGEELPER